MSEQEDRFDPEFLESFKVPEPSPDLGDRFISQLAESRIHVTRRIDVTRGKSKRRTRVLTGVGIAAVAALLLVIALRRPGPQSGTVAASERTITKIGARGVAVAEAAARFDWYVSGNGNARVQQLSGNVFYRVESGGRFVVATAAGEVSVRGTCFRVEVRDVEVKDVKIGRQSNSAAADGANLAATVIVTVYEGKVILANEHGQSEVVAGERAGARHDESPRAMLAVLAATETETTESLPGGMAVARLLDRDRSQRARIAQLETELKRLKANASSQERGGDTPAKRPFEMSKHELAELAKTCDVPIEMPPTAGSSIMDQVLKEALKRADFSDTERAAVPRVIYQFQPAYVTALRGLYRELTGEDGEALDPVTLIAEIVQKSPAADIAAAKQIVAQERAGLRRPKEPREGTVMERYLRLAIKAANDFDTALSDVIPPDRVDEFRRHWGKADLGPGCPEELNR